MSTSGCDSIVNLTLVVLQPVANINPPPPLTCAQPSVLLSGAGSSTGGGVVYTWTASNGGHISGNPNTLNTFADSAGDYQLRVCRTIGGVTCCDSTEITVISNQTPPASPASIVGPATLCQGDTVSFSATSVVGATSYLWTVPGGVTILSGQNTQTITVIWNVQAGGNVCAAAVNLCGTSTPTCLPVMINPSQSPAQPAGNNALCAGATESYSIPPVPELPIISGQ